MKQSIQTTQLLCGRALAYLNLTCNLTLCLLELMTFYKSHSFLLWLCMRTNLFSFPKLRLHHSGWDPGFCIFKAFQVIPGCRKVWEGRKDLKIDRMECCPDSLIEEAWKVPLFNSISPNWPSSMSNIPIICIISLGKGIYSPECHC